MDNFHYWEFESEIKMIRIVDLKLLYPREDIPLEKYDNLYNEKFIIIFMEKKYIIFESEKLLFLLENLINNTLGFDSNKYFLNNSFIIDINNDLNTDNFIILENNQPDCDKDDLYHFFFLNYPTNYDKYKMYLTEIYSKSKFFL